MCQKDIYLKGDAKTCEKNINTQRERFVGPLKNISMSVACYDTLSFKMPFI